MPPVFVDLKNRGQLVAGMCMDHPDRDSLLDTDKEVGIVPLTDAVPVTAGCAGGRTAPRRRFAGCWSRTAR
jgi:hypothetical protein